MRLGQVEPAIPRNSFWPRMRVQNCQINPVFVVEVSNKANMDRESRASNLYEWSLSQHNSATVTVVLSNCMNRPIWILEYVFVFVNW